MAILLVGLGNPGLQYANTRHNAGWMLVDKVAKRLGVALGPSPFDGLIAEAKVGGQRLVLLKPLTFMNLSGDSAAPCASTLGIAPASVMVAADEVQLPVGRLKLSVDGSDGGHNGLTSMIERLGTRSFKRLRIGVGQGPKGMMREWVLSPFANEEAGLLEETLELGVTAVMEWCEGGGTEASFRLAMSHANEKNRQPLDRMLKTQARAESERLESEKLAAETKAAVQQGENDKQEDSTTIG